MVSTAQDIMSRYGIDQDFAASIESLGNDLGVDPMYLANTMYAESTLNPSEKNKAGSGAMGLIQFMPETAANLGTTTDELSRMTPVEQMEYVRRYFSADNLGAGRLRALRNDPSQHNVNMAVFLPSRIGKPVDTQIPQKYWSQNGSIRTPADYTRSAEERVNAYIQSNPADTQADTVDAQTDKMLFEEQPEDTFRPEVVPASLYTDAVISSTDEEALEVDDTLMAEHEEKIRRGKAPRGSKPTKEGGYYTEGEYGFRTNPEGEVVADLEVNSLENVVKSIGERLRTMLGNNEDSETLELNEGGLVESAREGVYSLGSRGAARELRDTVAKELGVYETSEEARSIANKYRLNVKETDTLRHILGAGLLKYIDKDFTQPLLLGTEVLDKLQVSLERLMDPNSEDIYRKSYYVQSIEEANRDIVNYQVGSALAKQYDTKDDFIKSAVKLVKDLGKGKTPVVVDKTLFGLVDIELTPQLSTGVVYNPDELKKRGVVYDPESGVMVSSRKVLSPPIPEPRPDPGYDPNYDATVSSRTVLSPPIPEPRPENLKKAEGGSVEKKVKFVKEDDDDVPDPPPGATPEEVADDIPAYLSTGEYVLPANVVRYIGLKNITGMHQRALSELQQMEDLDIIENVDENGYVEEDDDEMDYMKPEGVVEIVVAEHHPKGLMAMGFAEGGMINSDSSMEEGQVLPTSDIFSEGVYAQVNIDRSVDSENAVESDKVITAPVAFSSAPGKTAYLAYITPEEAASLRQAKQGFSSEGNGLEVSDGQYQHLGPKGLMSFNGQGGSVGGGAAPGGKGGGGHGPGDPDSTARSGGRPGGTGPGPGVGAAPGGRPGRGGYGPGDPDSTARSGGRPGGGTPSSDVGVGGGFGAKAEFDRALEDVVKDFTLASLLEKAEAKAAEVNQEARDRGISVTDGTGYSGPAGSPPGPAFGGGDEGNDAGGSQEFPEEEKADTDTEKSTDTDPLSDYIYVPGVGYRRKIRSVKPLSELKAGGYVTRNGIMAKGYSKGGDPGDGHGGGMSEFVEDLEPEVVEEEKPTDPYEGYTYVKGIGYVPTSRRATSIESASLSSIFTPGFLNAIGLMGDPNEEL
jgi:hypothetical protein